MTQDRCRHRRRRRREDPHRIQVVGLGGKEEEEEEEEDPGMGRMTINKGNFSLLDSRVNSPSCHSVF